MTDRSGLQEITSYSFTYFYKFLKKLLNVKFVMRIY
jgi:hypothetical protein